MRAPHVQRHMSLTGSARTSWAAQWIWAALAIGGLTGAFLVAFVIVTTLTSWGLFAGAMMRLDLAAWLILTGVLALLAVAASARIAFGGWPLMRAHHVAWAAVGLGLAVGVELSLHEWARLTIGLYDAEYVGLTAGLSFTLVGLSAAAFAVGIAPIGAARLPVAAVLFGAAVVAAVAVSNLPVIADGIGPHGWPLAAGVGASVGYAGASVIGALRRVAVS